jgi:type IV pilus assembly protein PilA
MNKLYEKLNNKAKKSGKGFTLVELLVVILIIGILIAIAVPAFLSQTDKASETAPQVNLRNVYSAAVAVRADNTGAFPASVSALKTGMTSAGEGGISALVEDATTTVPGTLDPGKVYVTGLSGNTIVLRARSATNKQFCASTGTGGAAEASTTCAP